MPEKIKEILDEWNPIGLTHISYDEYLPVAEQIADTIRTDFSAYTVCIYMKRALAVYGVDFRRPHKECMQIAEKIVQAIQEE